ncbi:MAG: molybdate ABC transporter substrate-binding protein [Peptoniphilaceae bacterium]|uniref:molybdate ABC transporter substrate-binding protein n=1 Tax=Parvimonas sp. TaxID=1944660 RepID=UPI0025F0806D|nr:molybdate ABC transporter substrate-binding protein [Parvimonas sp.]MCI5998074.1 molybdate ABC transporter substrate-binding protein [Parvimonas sp.]MDD7764146.1 molybdate ABC transporter substrate-binding protein [Peptoniphilaceae bacterium]MDY3050739.1 molybdate ABC transporter substrate-binding protein [Parvimonas sp.]
MNKIFKKLMIFTMICIFFVGCSTKNTKNDAVQKNERKKITVFAAASMTETMEQIKKNYEEKNQDVEIVYTFDSSGTLKKQIEQGAECDLFISAALKQMNALDKSKTPDAKVRIDENTRINLLENKVVLAVSDSNSNIKSFSDLLNEKLQKIALGNDDVPVGQYSKELLENINIWDKIQDKITFGTNVKEVTTWVKEGVADCGIVYATDAYSAKLKIVDTAKDGMIKTPVIYPCAVLENSKNKEDAKAFLDYLQTDECKEIFEKVGFTRVK